MVGEITPETIVDRNTFIIWNGDMPADFELKVEYRVSENGNSGINYRSERVDGIPFALRGYQADLNGKKNLDGSNYEERRRSTLASQGEKVTIPAIEDPDSIHLYRQKNFWVKRQVTGVLETKESLQTQIKHGDWNEYHLIIQGNRMRHIINGALMSEVIDEDPVNRRMEGLLGVQVHVGPPMTVEYRNFRIKDLSP